MWPANQWRMDICYKVNALSKFVKNPSIEHVDAMIDILRYCISTKNKGMCFKSPNFSIPHPLKFDLLCRTDSEFSKDHDRASVSGYILSIHFPEEISTALITNKWPCFNSIGYRTKKQSFIALSPHEAEVGAIIEGAKTTVWFRNLLNELGLLNSERSSVILSDNNSAIYNQYKRNANNISYSTLRNLFRIS